MRSDPDVRGGRGHVGSLFVPCGFLAGRREGGAGPAGEESSRPAAPFTIRPCAEQEPGNWQSERQAGDLFSEKERPTKQRKNCHSRLPETIPP
ncbi:hypothetical protein Y1Q_0001446 [Alligator mississippiensis]|uniref:Uncharacterized protein n=1 Tax=Alligator mississippiensis TaxID=8496 RepID=A0A151M9N9_ALLMI|nr:hypothetical protein Y1Q_0001446 [Alligator mississippiensis]